jgi:hypothetical protein
MLRSLDQTGRSQRVVASTRQSAVRSRTAARGCGVVSASDAGASLLCVRHRLTGTTHGGLATGGATKASDVAVPHQHPQLRKTQEHREGMVAGANGEP